jgi:hypothetical protein
MKIKTSDILFEKFKKLLEPTGTETVSFDNIPINRSQLTKFGQCYVVDPFDRPAVVGGVVDNKGVFSAIGVYQELGEKSFMHNLETWLGYVNPLSNALGTVSDGSDYHLNVLLREIAPEMKRRIPIVDLPYGFDVPENPSRTIYVPKVTVIRGGNMKRIPLEL